MWNKVKELIKKLYNDQRIRFLFVGCLNTGISFITTMLCYLIMGYSLGEKASITDLQNFFATAIGYAVGTVNSYLWNKFFTFKSKEKSFAEVARFLGVCAVQYGVNFGLTILAKQFIQMHLVYTVLVTLVCMVISYIGHSLFSFGKKFTKEKN